MRTAMHAAEGIVAIGRNEGERLRRCFESLSGEARTVVYVDSGSTDGSRELARSKGAHVVELDLSSPFTAARARNAGFARLMEVAPDTELVQFVDGDCELDPAWLPTAARVLRDRDDVGVVCGRRRERHPEASVYNRLCDVEWDLPAGEVRACGGDALVRARAFRLVGGYDPAMIAGEEPDLCLRLRRQGFRVLALGAEMTLHDAAMTRWTQWWQRAVRTGHTTAELLAKYGATPEHRRSRRALSALFWAVVFPLAWLALFLWALSTHGWAWASLAAIAPALAYAQLFARIRHGGLRAGRSAADARAYALSCIFAKWPETWGMLLYAVRRLARREAHWIEYKDGPRGIDRTAAPLKRRLRSTAVQAARLSGILAHRERSLTGALTVLMYHRVLPEERCRGYPFPSLAMPLDAFREQVRWLAGRGAVLPLSEALARNGERSRPPLFALTFDDGYDDSSDVAQVLEDAGLRGTFFVTTGFVGTSDLLWFDRAALLFAALPEPVRRDAVRDARGGGSNGVPQAGADAAAWARCLKDCAPAERAAILASLERAAGGAPAADGFRSLTVAQVAELHRRGHEIGSHSVSHAILTGLDDASLRSELESSRDAISGWIDGDVPGFCYPNGDHDERVVAAVVRAGHAYACTTRDGIHPPGGDPFRIRRVDVVPERVTDGSLRFDSTAFRRELCGLYRRRGSA